MSQWRRLKKKCSRYLQEKGFSFVLYILGNIFAQHLFSLSLRCVHCQMVVMMACAALSAATFSFLTSFSRWMLKLLSPLLLIIFAIKSFNFSLFLSLFLVQVHQMLQIICRGSGSDIYQSTVTRTV